jgi:hypothetical protein
MTAVNRKKLRRRFIGIGALAAAFALGLVIVGRMYMAAEDVRVGAPAQSQQTASPSPPAISPPPSIVPDFPWPPPKASASYVLPNDLLKKRETVGDVSNQIITALEADGYVERSFFLTPAGGVALVTHIEKINDDGSPSNGTDRWPTFQGDYYGAHGLIRFLEGLFYIDPGHYRVIVFILQDLPFSQSSREIVADEARAWLATGANVLPRNLAAMPFGDGYCTVLIYEFASDGSAVRLVESSLTGKEHLERSGILALLERQQ